MSLTVKTVALFLLFSLLTWSAHAWPPTADEERKVKGEWEKYRTTIESKIKTNEARIREIEHDSQDISKSQAEKASKMAQKGVKGIVAYITGKKEKAVLNALEQVKTLEDMYKEQGRFIDATFAIADGELGKLKDKNKALGKEVALVNQYLNLLSQLSIAASSSGTIGDVVSSAKNAGVAAIGAQERKLERQRQEAEKMRNESPGERHDHDRPRRDPKEPSEPSKPGTPDRPDKQDKPDKPDGPEKGPEIGPRT